MVPTPDNLGLISRLDGATIIDAAITHGRIMQRERELGSHLLVAGPRGTMVRNPVSMTLAGLRQAMSGHVKALGLSPQARMAMDIPNEGGADELNTIEQLFISNVMWKRGLQAPNFDDPFWDLSVPDDVFAEACVKWPR